ncbi:hypothetical protein BDZ97DRAFT_567682 [Flammula alnicola]|nr:hypothetical protein BDZ97DRAFT_567682 [Flammula alnicola]
MNSVAPPSHEDPFCALDTHAENTSMDCSRDLRLSLNHESHLWSHPELSYLAPRAEEFWQSEGISEFGEDEDVLDFPGPFCPKLSSNINSYLDGERPSDISVESRRERFPIDNILPLSLQCDWSPDTRASQEKVVSSTMGTALTSDDSIFAETNLDPPDNTLSLMTRTRGEHYVDICPFSGSLFDHDYGIDSTDDHGILDFEAERASISLASGDEEDEHRLTVSLEDHPSLRIYPDENSDKTIGTGDIPPQAQSIKLEASGVQGFQVMDFD